VWVQQGKSAQWRRNEESGGDEKGRAGRCAPGDLRLFVQDLFFNDLFRPDVEHADVFLGQAARLIEREIIVVVGRDPGFRVQTRKQLNQLASGDPLGLSGSISCHGSNSLCRLGAEGRRDDESAVQIRN